MTVSKGTIGIVLPYCMYNQFIPYNFPAFVRACTASWYTDLRRKLQFWLRVAIVILWH